MFYRLLVFAQQEHKAKGASVANTRNSKNMWSLSEVLQPVMSPHSHLFWNWHFIHLNMKVASCPPQTGHTVQKPPHICLESNLSIAGPVDWRRVVQGSLRVPLDNASPIPIPFSCSHLPSVFFSLFISTYTQCSSLLLLILEKLLYLPKPHIWLGWGSRWKENKTKQTKNNL